MDEQQAISITQALNHIQSWVNAGEYDKVIQGCAEILEIEPGNQRALALMKIAEGRRHVEATSPMQATEPQTAPQLDPLAKLQVEDKPKSTFSDIMPPANENIDKKRMFFAMLIPAVVVVILGGSLIWFLANRDREETIADNSDSITDLSENKDYLADNEDRVKQMTLMAQIIDQYRVEKGKCPSVEDIELILVQSEDFSKVPVDPKQGEVDAEEKPFGYMYAVYDSRFGKEDQYYILSALFEDSQGVGYEWNVGESVKNFENYRDISQENVTFIGGND